MSSAASPPRPSFLPVDATEPIPVPSPSKVKKKKFNYIIVMLIYI